MEESNLEERQIVEIDNTKYTVISRKAKEFGKPLLVLTIDEHTGEAGFVTRLEAFVDLMRRKKRRKEKAKKEVPAQEVVKN